MSVPEFKRFYATASVRPADDGYGIWLDERRLKTPARAGFAVPSAPLAEAIAAEWNAQGDKLDIAAMHFTALANAAIDRITPEREAFARRLAAYGRNDLLCYRAAEPVELAVRLAKGWQPVLDWLAATHGARLVLAEGVVHVDQPPDALTALERATLALDAFRLGPLHVLTTAMGSLGLGLAVLGGRHTPGEAFDLSRIDEEFQIERWGRDLEAEYRTARIRAEAENAGRFLQLLS
jgi:chaperone required for assembly of F1-ATPase